MKSMSHHHHSAYKVCAPVPGAHARGFVQERQASCYEFVVEVYCTEEQSTIVMLCRGKYDQESRMVLGLLF